MSDSGVMECVGGGGWEGVEAGDRASSSVWETSAELFLFQGQKGDPGLSPGKAHDGTKVSFEGPQAQGRRSEPWGTAGPWGSPPGLLPDKSGKVKAGLVFTLKSFRLSPHQTQSHFLLSSGIAANKTHRRFPPGHSW